MNVWNGLKCRAGVLAVLFGLLALRVLAAVPNGSFEDGTDGPASWTAPKAGAAWLEHGAADGNRAVAVTGTGNGSGSWNCTMPELEPNAVYRLTFQARGLGATSGGTAISGPDFCNRDLGALSDGWRDYASIFMAPLERKPFQLRFGQWQVNGTVAFDDVRLVRCQPTYSLGEGVTLGEGESLSGNAYAFTAPFTSESGQHSRPLQRHNCGFNSNRWVVGGSSEIVYQHSLSGRRQLQAGLDVAVGWYNRGQLQVAASADGQSWRDLGVLDKESSAHFAIPEALLPSDSIWIRLRGSQDASLQVTDYAYMAQVGGAPVKLTGHTRFVTVVFKAPDSVIEVDSLGVGRPGMENTITARVVSGEMPVRVRVTVTDGDGKRVYQEQLEQPQGRTLQIPYSVAGSGSLVLRFSMEGENGKLLLAAEAALQVPELYSAGYGELLNKEAGVWWCSSGWKVARERPLPSLLGTGLRIRAAAGEAEAAQLVIRPDRELTGFAPAVGDLVGPAGRIAGTAVEILRVGYVDVARATDATGVAGAWPDPLPPIAKPLTLAADINQPLWMRVTVPPGTAAGTYQGTVTLRADGWQVEVPLLVEVYGFPLPERMTCKTAFGFSPGNVWRYQKITDATQKREVLAKYWDNFSRHHISPYEPAPLDPLVVTWGQGWDGGRMERDDGHGALRLDDDSTTANRSVSHPDLIPIGKDGLTVKLSYRTATEQPFTVSFTHYDANGNWMSGRNRDMRATGSAAWRSFEQTVSTFPVGAATVRLNLWATAWDDKGTPVGTVWFRDISVVDAGSGKVLLQSEFDNSEAQLKPRFDWTAWDRAMTLGIDKLNFNTFRLNIPGLGGGTFFDRYEPELLGYGETTPQYQIALKSYGNAIQSHLRDKGWLDEAFVYWFDEPDPKDYDFVQNGFRKLKEVCPDVGRMLTEQVEEGLIGGPTIWCPVTSSYNPEKSEARRVAGETFWWYVCTGPKAPYCTLFIDHPGTEMRTWLWQTWQYGIEGILIWETNYWTSPTAYPDSLQNPYLDPMGWTNGYGVPSGTRLPWGNGDGRLIYPPEAAADGQQPGTVLEGPVDSIRWEMLRDGIEDYEYLVLLRKLVDATAGKTPAADLARYRELLTVPKEISAGMTTFTRDPALIEARRDQIARAIEQLLAP